VRHKPHIRISRQSLRKSEVTTWQIRRCFSDRIVSSQKAFDMNETGNVAREYLSGNVKIPESGIRCRVWRRFYYRLIHENLLCTCWKPRGKDVGNQRLQRSEKMLWYRPSECLGCDTSAPPRSGRPRNSTRNCSPNRKISGLKDLFWPMWGRGRQISRRYCLQIVGSSNLNESSRCVPTQSG
jgi:hypothetical protein